MLCENENKEDIIVEESNNFIDDETEFSDQEPSNYRDLPVNVTLTYEEAMALSDYDVSECSDPENFVFGKYSPPDFCEFNGWEKRIEKFNNSLKQLCENSIDSFFNAVIRGAYFKLKGKTANFNGD